MVDHGAGFTHAVGVEPDDHLQQKVANVDFPASDLDDANDRGGGAGRVTSPDGEVQNGENSKEIQSTLQEKIRGGLETLGLPKEQVIQILDLAQDYLLPLASSIADELSTREERNLLLQHFGGEARWRIAASQIKKWGEANLDEQTLAALSCSARGILMLERMMNSRGPAIVADRGTSGEPLTEEALAVLVRDPRYWKSRDKSFVDMVTMGYQRLYTK